MEFCNAHFFLGNQDYTQDTALENDRPMFLFVWFWFFVYFLKVYLYVRETEGDCTFKHWGRQAEVDAGFLLSKEPSMGLDLDLSHTGVPVVFFFKRFPV